jgi:hypothetical protein
VEFNPGGIPQIRCEGARLAKFIAKYRQIFSFGWLITRRQASGEAGVEAAASSNVNDFGV